MPSRCCKPIATRTLGLLPGGLSLALAVLATLSPPRRAAAADATGTISGEVAARSPKLKAGVVVYLEKVAGASTRPGAPVTMDQRKMVFLPHVLPIMRGTTVRFLNSDDVRHNIFTPDGDKYNLGTWPKGEVRVRTFTRPGVYRQLCNVHPEMEAFIVVLDNPFFAATGPDGRFAITGVPPGSYVLKVWSEKLSAPNQNVKVAAGQTTTLKLKLAR